MSFIIKIKKIVAVILVFATVFSFTALPIHQAKAIPVAIIEDLDLPFDVVNLVETTIGTIASIFSSISDKITAGGISSLVIKEYVLDPIANIIAKAIIRAVTNSVVSWIQGGGKPKFVQDLGQEVTKAADEAGGAFLNRLAGTNLCSGFSVDFRFNLTLPRIKRITECTVSGIISAVKNTTFNKEIGIFYNDFEVNGAERGIEKYLSLLDPANSFTNSFDKAYYTKASLEIQVGQKKIKIFDWGSGFKPFEWDETVDDPSSCEPGPNGQAVCQKVKTGRTMTPGKVVAETLQKSIDVGLDVGAVADELDEAIIAIINALINRVVNGSIEGSSGGGLTSEGLGDIPFDSGAGPSNNVPAQRVDDIVIRTEIAQLAVIKRITTIDETIIKINEDITKLNEKIKFCEGSPAATECSPDPEKINQYKAEKAALEEQLKKLREQRAKEKIDFDKLNSIFERGLALKDGFLTATEPADFTNLGQKMVTLEEDFGIIIFDMENRPEPRLVNGRVEFQEGTAEPNRSGQAGSNSIDNTIKEIEKINERALFVASLLDKKIAAEKDGAKKLQLTQFKNDIQKLITELNAEKTKISAMKDDPLADVKTETKTIIAKIKSLNQKLNEAMNL